MKQIFDEVDLPFDTPKPVSLINRILQLSTDEDSIVLDSFADSGTTAQSVLEQKKKDGGNRKFILVEMEDYANDITAERMRRVIKGVPESKNFNEGTGGTFSYFELGNPIEMESILQGDNLPSYGELARYLFYKPDVEYLKSFALTLETAKDLGAYNGKKRLIFAPAKFVHTQTLLELRIEYCQLPFEIYKLKK